jgi:hypothetical protein
MADTYSKLLGLSGAPPPPSEAGKANAVQTRVRNVKKTAGPASQQPSKAVTTPPPHATKKPISPAPKALSPDDTVTPRHHDTTTPRNHETMIPLAEHGIFEVVRKAVKQIGKEAATHRFTLDEKNHLADIEYTYKRQGIRTSENEITRIAINYFIEDYRQNGEESLLAIILKRLNS